ncbi:DUF2326 domain-containing protein [Clostridium estertheticum]|uniref:DUF2326 domain-containing protein n=1 Tax=Clostridium estertheticum TaxID=238834 RepID=A0A5N7IZR3_9CLOT|nr:DUF2326 domain-containing protein [Clostridium estertheticum]MPQ31264.1 DUF2326 domain-containing protein [Clostridium estertheticum]MPQ61938.1 DUF2326 domain-containing protein [Clostridium estertheticum]
MKILKLVIKDPSNQVIRDIDFEEFGVSFIYGDIQEPKNLGATINSLGKTLLIKCIDYIYGSNEDPKIIKSRIHGYTLEATVKYKDIEYKVIRILGKSNEIIINDAPYSLTDYKNFFNIKRSIIGKQFIINKKSNIISYNTNASKYDVVDFLFLLGLNNLLETIESIYSSQDAVKKYKNNKVDLVKFYGDFDLKQIDEEIYFVDKEVDRLNSQMGKISSKIKSIEISDIQMNIVEEYASKSSKLKKIKGEFEKSKLECSRLIEFIENSNKVDISSEHILAIYNKTKIEVPTLIKKKIEDVEIFHQKVFKERKEFLSNKKVSIEKDMKKMEGQIQKLSSEIDRIGKIISLNQVYQESIALYENYNNELQEIKYKEGKLSQIKNVEDNITTEDTKLTTNFDLASHIQKDYSEVIKGYRDFIYGITKVIYDDDVNSYFDIKIRKKHQTSRPVLIELTLKGDTGEGVSEIKKNLIDYLLFKCNSYIDFFVQDSSCYNGIDPRQVSGMLTEVEKIAQETKKQAIISINKYQLGNYNEIIEFVKDKSSIILSEKDKLFKFDFE